MTADNSRFLSAASIVLCVIAIVMFAVAGCRSPEPYISCVLIAVMSIFVGTTIDD